MAKVTIETISQKTGLSRGTVSRAINNRPDISQATRQRVIDACQELNYVPSHTARALATGRSWAFALVTQRLDTRFVIDLAFGAVNRAMELGYLVHLLPIGEIPRADSNPLLHSLDDRIDGALLVQVDPTSFLHECRAISGKKPVISTSQMDGTTWDVLSPDYRESGRLIARHLIARGRQNLLYAHRPAADPQGLRLAGFEEICRQQKYHCDQVVVHQRRDSQTASEAMSELASHIGAADAAAGTDCVTALQICQVAAAAGRRPGVDLLVAGQGNENYCSDLTPELTSTDFSGIEIGQRAVDLLVQRLNEKRMDSPTNTLVAPTLVCRSSTLT